MSGNGRRTITRREFLGSAAAVSGAALVGRRFVGPSAALGAEAAAPPAEAWELLRQKVGGRLVAGASPVSACRSAASAPKCAELLANFQNPFYIQDLPGGTQTNGWLDAWTAEDSRYAIAAESADDIAAGVAFAREHGVKLVVKGAGHDYKGRSNARDSLLVWTHRMREVEFHESFRPTGTPSTEPGVPALSAGAGTRWVEAYRAASAHGHYVQGGGCTSVGVAGGFIQGGGYGSFSKRFGTGAGGVLEFEVVTADGKHLVANERQNADLFWALRGGGGGTFGIVTRVTLLAHAMPNTIGILRGKFRASSDDAFKELIARLVAFYPGALNNPAWGEQIAVRPDNTIELFMTYLDLDSPQARAVWQPMLDFASERATLEADLAFATHPFADLWSVPYWEKTDPAMIKLDDRPGSEPGTFWWATNQGEVAEFLYTYQSRWIPRALFEPSAAPKLVRTLFDASRHEAVRLQINKGLSGAAPEATARDRKTSIHPGVFDAAAIVILASRGEQKFPGVKGHEPDLRQAREVAARTSRAMEILRAATPGAGTYGNESDYFEKDWKDTFYGSHYARLLEIKRKYDPENLFRVHQGVGSDGL